MVEVFDMYRGREFFSELTSGDNMNTHGDYVLNPFFAEMSLEINGEQDLVVSCPLKDYIREGVAIFTVGSVVVVDVEPFVFSIGEYHLRQLFSIYSININNNEVTFRAEPIIDRLMRSQYLVDVRPTNLVVGEAFIYLLGNSFGEPLITMYSPFDTSQPKSTAYYQNMTVLEAVKGTQENSMLQRWGVNFNNDNSIIYWRKNTAYHTDEREWTFQYGKDLTGIQVEYDGSAIVRWVRPKGYNDIAMSLNYTHSSGLAQNGGVWSPDTTSPIISDREIYAPKKCITFDNVRMRADIQEGEDTAGLIVCDNQNQVNVALYNEVLKMYEKEKIDKPNVTISINAVDLNKNIEIPKEIRHLFKNKITVGSVVGVYSAPHLIDVDTLVTSIKYDCIRGETTSLVLANNQYDFFDLVNRSVNTSEYIYYNRQ